MNIKIILQILTCLSYEQFLQVLNWGDDSYSASKFDLFRSNLSTFLLEVDDDIHTTLVDYAVQKSGGGL